MNTRCTLYVLEVPLIFSMRVPQLLKSNITVDGLLLQRSCTIVIDWVSLVLIVLWLLELEGTGVNVIISVGVVVLSPELACTSREPWSSSKMLCLSVLKGPGSWE